MDGHPWYVSLRLLVEFNCSVWESWGQYLSKTYMEVKKRPHYIIQKSNDEETEKNK